MKLYGGLGIYGKRWNWNWILKDRQGWGREKSNVIQTISSGHEHGITNSNQALWLQREKAGANGTAGCGKIC